jgi:hypothetical protein
MEQNILFPKGIFYDKEIDAYRTSGMNEVIRVIAEESSTSIEKKSDKLLMMITCRL